MIKYILAFLLLASPLWEASALTVGLTGTGVAASSCGASPYEQNVSVTQTDYWNPGKTITREYVGLYQYAVSGATTLCKVGFFLPTGGIAGTPTNVKVRVWTMTGTSLNSNICTSNAITVSANAWNYTDTSTLNCSLSASTNYAITVDVNQTSTPADTNFLYIPTNNDGTQPWSSGWATWNVADKAYTVGPITATTPALKLYKME